MADITQLRFGQLLRRTFGLKGADVGRALGAAIGAQYDIGDPYHPEDRALRGERLFGNGNGLVNTAGLSFTVVEYGNPLTSGKVSVLKRVMWMVLLPTAANQPGNVYFCIRAPLAISTQPTTTGRCKDSRFGPGAFSATGHGTTTVGAAGVPNAAALYTFNLFPGAAVVPTFHQVDNLDIVLQPGFSVFIEMRSDILPVGSYTWFFFAEGYERIADPNEFAISMPP